MIRVAALSLLLAAAGAALAGIAPAGPGRGDAATRARAGEPAGHPPGTTGRLAAGGHLAVRVLVRTRLRARPAGRPLARLSPRTEWGSQRVLAVVRRHPGWFGVLAPQLRNGAVGWIPAYDVEVRRVRWSLRADLSRHELVARRDGRVVHRVAVGAGRPGSPTPTGRFAITDKLLLSDPGSPYGCCVLALSGRQPRLPAGWRGGDRLAIHSSADPDALGRDASSGCLRAGSRAMRWLVRSVPLGTQLLIRR